MGEADFAVSCHAFPSLRGRNAVVTGGSRGLGKVMALALIRHGANVTITGGRSSDDLAATEVEAKAIGGGECLTMLADIGDPKSCDRVVHEATATFGSVDVLFNNAARGPGETVKILVENAARGSLEGSGLGGRFWEGDVDGHIRMLLANIGGPFLMTRACVPGMIARGFGRIINISVARSTMVRVGQGPYGPTKAALEASSRIWATELVGTGVTVNVLLPGGPCDTALIPGAAVGTRAAPFEAGVTPRGQEGKAAGMLPPAIMGPPALWLASDESHGVTGRRFVARDWSAALPPAEAAALAEAERIDWPHII